TVRPGRSIDSMISTSDVCFDRPSIIGSGHLQRDRSAFAATTTRPVVAPILPVATAERPFIRARDDERRRLDRIPVCCAVRAARSATAVDPALTILTRAAIGT